MDLGFLKEFGMECNPSFVAAADFFSSLSPEESVFLLIRHSIRRHITPQDADSGAHVGLTDEGRDLAVALGKLFPVDGSAVYFSSPVGRCVDTANCIQEGRKSAGGPQAPEVEILDCLGDFYVKDFDAYKDILNEKFYPSICEWIAKGEHPAFYPIAPRAEELRSLMLKKGRGRFNIFSTHDSWVVPTLAHFCGFKFTPGCWMNYLTGIAFVVSPGGRERIVPVAGLSTGYLKF